MRTMIRVSNVFWYRVSLARIQPHQPYKKGCFRSSDDLNSLELVEDGDDLEVDFKNGEFINLSKKSKHYLMLFVTTLKN